MYKFLYKFLLIVILLIIIAWGIIYFAMGRREVSEASLGKVDSDVVVEEPFSDWQEFKAYTEKFKVLLPSTPQYANDLVTIPMGDQKRYYELYAADQVNGSLFMISMVTYPNDVDISNTDEMLHGMVNELMSSNPDNQLISLTNKLFQTYPALDFSFENQEFKVKGQTFMINKTLYVLAYIARLGDFNVADYQYFVDSFVLLPKALGTE